MFRRGRPSAREGLERSTPAQFEGQRTLVGMWAPNPIEQLVNELHAEQQRTQRLLSRITPAHPPLAPFASSYSFRPVEVAPTPAGSGVVAPNGVALGGGAALGGETAPQRRFPGSQAQTIRLTDLDPASFQPGWLDQLHALSSKRLSQCHHWIGARFLHNPRHVLSKSLKCDALMTAWPDRFRGNAFRRWDENVIDELLFFMSGLTQATRVKDLHCDTQLDFVLVVKRESDRLLGQHPNRLSALSPTTTT